MQMLDRTLMIVRTSWSRFSDRILSSSQPCILCGSNRHGYTTHGQLSLPEYIQPYGYRISRILCGGCLAHIPWITDIKCETCGRPVDCPDCVRRQDLHFVQNRSAVAYREEMREWLALYKYRGHERLSHLLGLMLCSACERLRMQLGKSTFQNSVITYVPINSIRMKERGFNQAEQLASIVAERFGLPLLHLLRRTRHTDKQSKKHRRERITDLRNAIEWQNDNMLATLPEPSCILLVDDIYTTGSTLNECSRILQETTGLPVYGLTWAR